jgi:uncharacterized protein
MCKRGCAKCCVHGLTLLPLEADYIRKNVSLKNVVSNTKKSECVFLKNDVCQIYQHRPVLCRTQGYPLLYRDDNSDKVGVSYCDLNFKKIKDGFKFDGQRIINMNKVNTILYAINLEYLKSIGKIDELRAARVPMKELLNLDKQI